MIHSLEELRILARVYLAAEGLSASTLSRKITGARNGRSGNEKLIGRLLAGSVCLAPQAERMSRWLTANWTDKTPWPAEVPRVPANDENRVAAE